MTSIKTYFSEISPLINQIKEKKELIKLLRKECKQKLYELNELNLLIQNKKDNLKSISDEIILISAIQKTTKINTKVSISWNDITEEMDFTEKVSIT